ncbi:DUF927 domain-containing protein [Gluconacetobacter diazotrophicus]|uniref:Uncharacterized protein n=2 Tax=Gluconacetobacter diazotrophicus (strain ATCC 49037 / DSM 5601 / CCUG 37298 / CIP 103539 / LMG 7603 / PAl5) TaxID=272568 RepID=A9H6T2_GLUDA|nr:DUF927 domain-containing protein [Gluconacetobacter diazotrophicus]CAP57543.1 conserved hypothetical protein [Gluconacetobacter diazotrophicus PA1 5]
MNAVPPNAPVTLPAGIPADPFQPLTPTERRNAASAGGKDEVWEPISPAPSEPELPRGASAIWVYRDEEGRPLCARFRVDREDGGKDILPLTYGRRVWIDRTGQRRDITGWHWKQAAKPLPLYGLDRLAAQPDASVLLVEGEKTADAAQRLFPDYVVMTSQGGGKAVGNNDWAPLAGREVTIWPDNDKPGLAYADSVVAALREVGARVIKQVQLPPGLPDGWDVADDVPEGIASWSEDPEPLLTALNRAQVAAPNVTMPKGYLMKSNGLYYRPEQTGEDIKPDIWISEYFEIIAETNDGDGFGWGLLIRWWDRDGRMHEWSIPKRMVHGEGKDIAGDLEDAGLNCSIAATRLLRQLIASVRTIIRLRCVDRAGWHRTDDGHAFILPGGFTIGGGRRSVVFQSSRATVGREFTPGGTLADWQKQVAAYAVGNSRLALFLSAAFAGPLLDIMGEQSGGIHLVGKSQSGKSTAAFVAGSVWGKGDRDGQIRAWRGTANGLEGIASETSDTVLILDEMGQAEPREVGEIAYMLANNTGKQRAGRNGDARARKTWRVLFLSTGEVTLAAKMGEAGKRAMAGQEVRLVNVPADAGAGMGAFEQLHGMRSAGALADHLRVASRTFYGVASRHFLDALVRDRAADPKALEAVIRAIRSRFEEAYVPAGNVDGQVRSVAARFALIAAAGEIATDYRVLPWARGEAMKAAGVCFQAWLSERGSVGASEDVKAIEQVRAFIEQHGESRFTNLTPDPTTGDDRTDDRVRTINRAGFKRRVTTQDGGRWEYLILPVMWKTEVCKGLDAANVAKVLRDAGYLTPGSDGKGARVVKIPGEGPSRAYVVSGSIMGGDDA